MGASIAEVKSERFNLTDAGIYTMFGLWPKNAQCRAELNGKELETEVRPWRQYSALDRFDVLNNKELDSVAVSVKLPQKLPVSGKLTVCYEDRGQKKQWFRISVKSLKNKYKNPQIYIDQILRKNSDVSISGWIASDKPSTVEGVTGSGEKLSGMERRFPRADVALLFPECEIEENSGFMMSYKDVPDGLKLKITAGDETVAVDIPMKKSQIMMEELKTDISKGLKVLKENGIKTLVTKAKNKVLKKNKPVEYSEWIKHNFITKEQQEAQKKEKFEYEPLISIVVPLYKTPENFLNALVDSVKAQTYSNWELVLSDGSGAPSPLNNKLKALAEEDKRILVVPADKPHKIVENTNRAIEAATGEFIAFGDHDDLFEPDALFECVKALNKDRSIELIYTDEDKTDGKGKEFYEPQMKPDFNLDLLRTVNYICHLTVMKKTLLDKTGYLNNEYEGAQDYDIILRAVENTKNIRHIPRVLYHWRCHENSTAENPESKKYAFESGKRAVQAHFDRCGIKAEVSNGEWPGLYRTKYIRDHDPLVSILIPNKDHIDDLKRCIDSIEEKSTYKNIEYIIIENNSTEEETFEYYKELEKANPKAHVLYYEGDFNYSRINNFGAKAAKGEYLWLLNNDTSMISEDAVEELLGFCMRDDVGIVGARLYYEDDTVQHAGVIVGFGGVAGHCFVMQPRGNTGYCHRIISAQDYSAVTAACMMVKREAFDRVGGLNEELKVAFNDIDFCLRIREAGYLVVYAPYAEFYHYESKSRGMEDSPEKISRFNDEIAAFQKNWGQILEDGDPYYNPNLTLDSQDFSLRKNY